MLPSFLFPRASPSLRLQVLRLYPPSPLAVRRLEQDVTLRRLQRGERAWGHPDKEPVTLPAGSSVLLPTWWIQRSELNFHDPLVFDPERFMPRNKPHMMAPLSCSSVAFSGGDRDCVGQRFAMMELLSLLVTVIRRVKVEPVPGHVLEPEMLGAVQKPKGGLLLIISKR